MFRSAVSLINIFGVYQNSEYSNLLGRQHLSYFVLCPSPLTKTFNSFNLQSLFTQLARVSKLNIMWPSWSLCPAFKYVPTLLTFLSSWSRVALPIPSQIIGKKRRPNKHPLESIYLSQLECRAFFMLTNVLILLLWFMECIHHMSTHKLIRTSRNRVGIGGDTLQFSSSVPWWSIPNISIANATPCS